MKTHLLFILAAFFLIALSAAAPAVENPVGSPTVPPSSIRSGLIRSPNPIDTSGNLVITGNVGGGKHFRGIVPYNAVSDFRGRLYSTSLDSFLRRSASSADFERYTGKVTPYYSQMGTVTTTKPGHSAVVSDPTTEIAGDTTAEYTLLQQDQSLSDSDILIPNISSRPMSMTLQQLERIISSEQDIYEPELQGEETTGLQQDLESDMQRFRQGLLQVDKRITEFKEGLIIEGHSSTVLGAKPFGEDVGRRSEVQAAQDQADEDEQLDIYEQMRRQLEDLEEDSEQLSADQETEETSDSEKQTERKRPRLTVETVFQETQDEGLIARGDKPQEGAQKDFSLDGLSEADLSARAKAIMGKHKTFASFSKDKFNGHIRAAEAYLKQGKYYRAADAYTLALLYKPGDPLAYAGKGYALFAAGEYMSSALYLSRAIDIFPEYVRFDIDIVAIVGDRDNLDNCIVDIKQWLEKSDAGELHFLLSYVYYRLGRFRAAKEAIAAAYEKMPDSPAVAVLKKVIDRAGQ